MSGFNNDITNSAGPASSAEPSMEEILASIRRILKDEEVGAEPAPEAAAAAFEEEDEDILVLDSAMVVPRVPELTAPPVFEPAALDPELVEQRLSVPEQAPEAAPEQFAEPVIETLIPEPEGAQPEEHPAHLSSELPDPDFPELGSETIDLGAPDGDPPGSPAAEPEPVLEVEPRLEEDFGSAKEDVMADDRQQNVQPPFGLVGDAASEAAASSIGSLIRSISSERSIAVGRPGLTLEDLVREELRPLLKSWLDSNLPALVERIVRAEIQRVVERSAV